MRALPLLLAAALAFAPAVHAVPAPSETADAGAHASEDAKAVLRLFNAERMLREGLAAALAEREAEGASEAELEFLRATIDEVVDEEVLDRFGAALDRIAPADDLADVADFLETPAGEAIAEAMRGVPPTPENMEAAIDALPADIRAAGDRWSENGALQRVTQAMENPAFQNVGVDYGVEIACRAAAKYPPEVLQVLRDQGRCPGPDGAITAPSKDSGKPGKR